MKFNSLKEVVEKYMKHDDAILIPGCGNSEFSLDLFDEGFTNTWSIDNSGLCAVCCTPLHQALRFCTALTEVPLVVCELVVVINQMTNRQGYRPEMRFLVMDVCEVWSFAAEKSTLCIVHPRSGIHGYDACRRPSTMESSM